MSSIQKQVKKKSETTASSSDSLVGIVHRLARQLNSTLSSSRPLLHSYLDEPSTYARPLLEKLLRVFWLSNSPVMNRLVTLEEEAIASHARIQSLEEENASLRSRLPLSSSSSSSTTSSRSHHPDDTTMNIEEEYVALQLQFRSAHDRFVERIEGLLEENRLLRQRSDESEGALQRVLFRQPRSREDDLSSSQQRQRHRTEGMGEGGQNQTKKSLIFSQDGILDSAVESGKDVVIVVRKRRNGNRNGNGTTFSPPIPRRRQKMKLRQINIL